MASPPSEQPKIRKVKLKQKKTPEKQEAEEEDFIGT